MTDATSGDLAHPPRSMGQARSLRRTSEGILTVMGRINLRLKVLLGVLAAVVAVVAFIAACGTDDGNGPENCAGSACDGGSPESSPKDGPGGDEGNTPTDGGKDADADASITESCDGGEPGTLDPSFGDGGMVWLKYAGAQVGGVAVQGDGKIIVVGATQAGFAVIRLLPTGALDTSWGTNGLVTTLIGSTGFFSAVALQPDGKILATGGALFAGGTDFAVARYSADGGLDPSFGDGGVITTDFGPPAFQDDYPQSIVLQPDGRILVGGYTENNSVTPTENFAVARYNGNGSLDTNFGTGGKVVVDVRGTADAPGVVGLMPGGKIVIAGGTAQTTSLSARFDVSAVRLNTDGTVDTSFADAGVLVSGSMGSSGRPVNDIKLDGNGSLILSGAQNADFGLVRITSGGFLDPTFGDGGVVATDFSARNDYASSGLVQADGRIIAVGFSIAGSTTGSIAVARYLPTGELDPTFGAAGKVTTPPPANADLFVTGAQITGCGVIAVGPWPYDQNTATKPAIGISRYRR